MAAGSGTRFGTNKLEAEFDGEKLYRRALSAIPQHEFYRVVVVSQYEEVLSLAKEMSYIAVENNRPQDGISRTIRLGMEKLGDADAIMFMVSDQPLLSVDTVAGEIALFRENSERIVALGSGTRRGNPAIFPKRFFNELRTLTQDNGGSHVIAAHKDALLLYQVHSPLELYDVDNPAALNHLSKITHTQK